MLINGSVIPDKKLVSRISQLKEGEKLMKEGAVIAAVISKNNLAKLENISALEAPSAIDYADSLFKINYNWEIFSKNEQAIQNDFRLITKGRRS